MRFREHCKNTYNAHALNPPRGGGGGGALVLCTGGRGGGGPWSNIVTK